MVMVARGAVREEMHRLLTEATAEPHTCVIVRMCGQLCAPRAL